MSAIGLLEEGRVRRTGSRCWSTTARYRASKIVRDGFRDDTWTRPGLGRKRGVFISPEWLDEHEGGRR